jgi:hypothetical protein
MAYNVFPDRAGGYALQDADWNTYLRDNLNSNTWQLVGTSTTPGAGVTFSSLNTLPFIHYRIIGSVRSVFASTGPHTVAMRLNGDTGNNYDRQDVGGTSAGGAFYSESLAQSSITIANMPGSTSPAGQFSSFVCDLFGVDGTSRNQRIQSHISTRNVAGVNGGYVWNAMGQWRNTAALTSILVFQPTSSFVDGSRISLYGLA